MHHGLVTDVPPEVVERLYGGPPRGFVAARDAAVAAAREAGDASGAAAIGRLRKPTTGAWLVNLLALRRPELLAALAELGGALREAQRDLRGPKLRELSARRRELVAALVEQARELAEAGDPGSAGGLPLREAEATLTAALADESVAERVRSGRMVRTTDYAGLSGPATTGGAAGGRTTAERAGPEPAARKAARRAGSEPSPLAGPRRRGGKAAGTPAARGGDRTRRDEAAAARREQAAAARRERVEAARREVAAARTAERDARVSLERAAAAEQAAAGRLARLDDELAGLRRRRYEAEAELDRLRRAHQAAHRARTAAGRRLAQARAARDQRSPGT